jgi:hypothetical protein
VRYLVLSLATTCDQKFVSFNIDNDFAIGIIIMERTYDEAIKTITYNSKVRRIGTKNLLPVPKCNSSILKATYSNHLLEWDESQGITLDKEIEKTTYIYTAIKD